MYILPSLCPVIYIPIKRPLLELEIFLTSLINTSNRASVKPHPLLGVTPINVNNGWHISMDRRSYKNS